MRKKILGLISLTVALFLVVALPAQAAGSKTLRQKFTILLDSERGGPVIATGGFFTSGTDAESPTGDTSVFTFPDGTLTIRHASTENGGTFKFNDFTCVGKFSDRGTYRSVSGTGAYKSVSVSGTFRVKGTEMHERTARGCGEEPIAFSALIHASGPISFGK
jgi:hypothetical protein